MCIEDKLVCIRIHKNLFDRVYHILNRYILAHKYIFLEWQMINGSSVLGYQVAIKQITNMPNLSIFLPNCWWHELPFASHSHRFWQLVPYLPWSHIESHFTPRTIKFAWWLICFAGCDYAILKAYFIHYRLYLYVLPRHPELQMHFPVTWSHPSEFACSQSQRYAQPIP